MNKNFLKLKKRLTLYAWIKSLAFGFSSGVFLSSLTLAIYKLCKAPPSLLICIAVGLISALLFTAAAFLALLPSEKRVAKKLDKKLGLNEKVQTMVAFKNEDGDMLEMQRLDTEKALGNISIKSLREKHFRIHFIMPVLALVMLVIALVIPNPGKLQGSNTEDDDIAFSLSPWQEQALKDLIEDVKKSDMESSPKNITVDKLEDLLVELRAIKTQSVMKASVIGAIKTINEAVDNHNSCSDIAAALKKNDLDSVKSLGGAVNTLSAITLGEELAELRSSMPKDSDTLAISSVAHQIKESLTQSGIDPGDPLYLSLDSFADNLIKTVSDSDKVSEQIMTELDDAFSSAGESIGSALLIQYTNQSVGDNTVRRLMQIFGIKESELPESSRPGSSSTKEDEGDYKPEENDDPLHSGGFGSGDMIYGSDDMIYDPELGKYVSYGEVINRYYAKISEQFVDQNVSQELEQLISDYFASLFNGSAKD